MSGGVAHDAVLDDRLDRALRRHGVEVRAEEEGSPAFDPSREPAEQVAGVRVDPRPGVVLVNVEPEFPQLRGHPVGDGTLVPGRARDGGELEEQREGVHF